MVKILYGEHSQRADLTGKSIAEVRELYKSEFSIPDRAKASLNGQQLKKELEPETKLGDEDKLSFEEKSGKGLTMLGAFLLTLAITGGLFAYTYTTTSQTITLDAAAADFASVSGNATPSAYTLLGRVRGAISAATLFDVSADTNYTAGIEVQVTLANPDELVEDYSFWMMRLQYVDDSLNASDLEGITQVISLDNPFVSFAVHADNSTGYIRCLGGSYRVLPFALGSTGADPVIFAQVVQAGAH